MSRTLALLLLLLPALALAAPALSPSLAPTLGKLRTLTDAKDYPAALALLAPAIERTAPDSYDRLVLRQIQGRIHITQNQLPAARDALEAAQAIATARPDYFEAPAQADLRQTLAQLHYQIAADQTAPADRIAGYRRALDHTRAWLALLPSPDAEARYFAASLRYSLATADPARSDPEQLRAALDDVHAGLLARLDPPARLRQLAVAILQQLDRPADTIPQLELLVIQEPDNPTLWRQLAATYLATPRRENHLRAILTFERAQARGHLADSASRLNHIHAYLQLDAHEPARRLLADGLRAGHIDSTARTWRFLASLDQEHATPDVALATLREARRQFPDHPDLGLDLARQLHAAGDLAEAYRVALTAAADSAKLSNPGRTHTYLAYLAHERSDTAATRRHLDTAATFTDARPDEIARLRAALDTR